MIRRNDENIDISKIIKNAERVAYNKAIDDVYKLIDEHEEEVYVGVVDDILKLKIEDCEAKESVVVLLGGRKLEIDLNNLTREGDDLSYFDFDEAQEHAEKAGKRLMTKEELEDLCECENWWDKERRGRVFKMQTPDGGFEEVFLPAAGCRYAGGTLKFVGQYGNYWSSSPIGTYGYSLHFHSTGVSPALNYNRQYGFSVRLVKDV